MTEQRYQAVLAVIADGVAVKVVAEKTGVSRQTVHSWLARYEAEGLDGLSDRSHRPLSCPHQMGGEAEAVVLEMRRMHRFWGPRRIVQEIGRRKAVAVVPSESAVYRCLVRAGLIEPDRRRSRSERFKRWERGRPMELWQMDVVGGFLIADHTKVKALTGVDDHSRFCISARLMPAERTQLVCDGLTAALRRFGCPEQILTDNGKVFTGRFTHPAPVEVLFDRICRENGIDHLLTAPRSPTTTGKIERFHRTLRAEFDTTRVFPSIAAAQAQLDAWVDEYNTRRPHQSLNGATPAEKFHLTTTPDAPPGLVTSPPPRPFRPAPDHTGPDWVCRKVSSNGVVCVSWQQVSVGKAYSDTNVDVLVKPDLLQIWHGNDLIKTVARTSRGEVRKKNASSQDARTGRNQT